jgi:anti-sigma-K factor RskA
MTTGREAGPSCHEIRQLLGVYVVGAIDPAERSVVDEHLSDCAACRDELAGLAGLPAMLSRVPAADVERLGKAGTGVPDMAEPPAELLNSLLRRVAVHRRSRMWRGIAAAAAAAVIAAGATTTAFELASAGSGPAVASGTNASAHIAARVDYSPTAWGTAARVQVSGIRVGTTCQFWVITRNGTRSYAGSWTVTATGYGQGQPWYSASAPVATDSVRAFQITASGKTLLDIPAS